MGNTNYPLANLASIKIFTRGIIVKSLQERWSTFLTLIFDPWNILLCVAVGIFFSISVGETDELNSALAYILVTISSAVLGGRIAQQWSSISETGVLVARGKSAVRGLKLLLQNVATLEGRIRSFSRNIDEIENNPDVVRRNYEEAIAICGLLQEETVSSIENWTDIVPDADIKSQIGEISKLKSHIESREGELSQLRDEISSFKGESNNEKESLRQKIQEKEQQIREMQLDLMRAKVNFGGVSGILGVENSGGISSLFSGMNVIKPIADKQLGVIDFSSKEKKS